MDIKRWMELLKMFASKWVLMVICGVVGCIGVIIWVIYDIVKREEHERETINKAILKTRMIDEVQTEMISQRYYGRSQQNINVNTNMQSRQRKFCTRCGNQVNIDSKFCNKCGFNLR